jgi:bisphosphoglycerate-independent phosphoglycerate mutase (AlkP superfamily)
VRSRTLSDGVLADVTPTLMELAGVTPAAGMSGHSLLKG